MSYFTNGKRIVPKPAQQGVVARMKTDNDPDVLQ
jgi:hypothetical protein